MWALPDVGPGPGATATDPATQEPAVAMGEAIRLTLHEQLAADERVLVFGEDVADAREAVLAEVEGKGGVFGTTAGLQRDFGQSPLLQHPARGGQHHRPGRGAGAAGPAPGPEIQFFDYIWPAMTQIKSEAATMRWRSNGAFTCPMVVRVPIGGYLTGGAIWHSQSGESDLRPRARPAHRLPVARPDAAGLLRAAFRAEDPVLFCEHKHLLRQPYTTDPFPDAGFVIPFGQGDVRRQGDDLTIVTWGATVEKSLQAAARAASHLGVETEVIDLRTIAPWDHELVADSLSATHRLLVVHEDILTAGFGAEVAAWAGEHCFGDLDAPVARVGCARHPRGLRAHARAGDPAAGRRHLRRHRRRLLLLTSAPTEARSARPRPGRGARRWTPPAGARCRRPTWPGATPRTSTRRAPTATGARRRGGPRRSGGRW